MTTQMLERTLTVSDVARQAGVAVSAVRFYEKHGLLVSERTSGNQRRFDRTAPCRIRVARVAQRVGMTVNDIRDLLTVLPEDGSATDEHWRAMYDAILAEGERRVRVLRRAMADIVTQDRLCEVPVDDQVEPTPYRMGPARTT
ncbi:MerR family transcriptional regulator [Luteipulveratus halotolerans]|uniref:HTH merR-type domain-containing protein n=1 Tax=Luteipulveratus halotolerans TaxID=1631356 RepID=A0A0L6CLI4_9MICO|nr:MerR family transcriptional regulator [Luteipulveratus halotolerans]KNX38584.1 hypothetical protein VV01_17850 [Luteipulveratus halotolerans]